MIGNEVLFILSLTIMSDSTKIELLQRVHIEILYVKFLSKYKFIF